jgi:hypothetical protein
MVLEEIAYKMRLPKNLSIKVTYAREQFKNESTIWFFGNNKCPCSTVISLTTLMAIWSSHLPSSRIPALLITMSMALNVVCVFLKAAVTEINCFESALVNLYKASHNDLQLAANTSYINQNQTQKQLELWTSNLEPRTLNLDPLTLSLELSTFNLEPVLILAFTKIRPGT